MSSPAGIDAVRIEQLRRLRRYDEAERAARDALAARPQDAELLMALAAVLLGAGRDAEGILAADEAVALAPRSERAHRIRALLLAQLGRHQEAVQAGYLAVSLAPEQPYAAIAYSTVLQKAGRLDDAMAVARRAVELDPAAPPAHLRLADVAAERGDQVTARAAYTQTLRLDPTHAGARHDLAVLDLRSRRPARALRGLVEAGRLDPSLPYVMTTVTAVLWRLSWQIRMWLIVATLLVIGVTAQDPFTGTWTGRAAGLGMLLSTAALGWWTVRDLPRATLPVVRAALRRDRPLAVTYTAIGMCLALHLAIVVTGIGLLAALAWPILGFLGVLALIVGVVRNRRRRSRRPPPGPA